MHAAATAAYNAPKELIAVNAFNARALMNIGCLKLIQPCCSTTEKLISIGLYECGSKISVFILVRH
jgi:hypothetical protein